MLFISFASACALALGLAGCGGVSEAESSASDVAGAAGDSTNSNLSEAARQAETIDPATCPVLPDELVFLNTVDASIENELRYAGENNFTGAIVAGYEGANTAILRDDAAHALSEVQSALEAQGLGLLVYDGFRPTRSVAAFVEWSHTEDDSTRESYYPSLEKPQLFELGYIAAESGHSLGGTVDLTLIDLETSEPLDMGGAFDLFDERSHYAFTGVTPEQFENRTTLRRAMIDEGFKPYPQEWWHFSYPVPQNAERLDFALEPCG